MTRATETSEAAATRQQAPDRPPVGLFLVLFAGMLAFALGLSALSASVGNADTNPSLTAESQSKASAEPANRRQGL